MRYVNGEQDVVSRHDVVYGRVIPLLRLKEAKLLDASEGTRDGSGPIAPGTKKQTSRIAQQ